MLIVTYKLTSHDKMAVYLEKKDGNRNADGIMKSYAINKIFKGYGEKAEREMSEFSMNRGGSSNSVKSSQSHKSGKSGSKKRSKSAIS